MIVPEELHKADSKPKQEAAETKPQEAGTSSEQATQKEQSGNASEIKSAVTTEEMSVEQTVSDNEGKSEGWTAELEQPKIITAVDTEVLFVLHSTGFSEKSNLAPLRFLSGFWTDAEICSIFVRKIRRLHKQILNFTSLCLQAQETKDQANAQQA